ncbi:MAG: IS256 family transposase [Acidimicrobiales bacterium]
MSTRVSPIQRIRADIDELFASDRDLGDVLEDVARLGVRLLMQTALEAEVTEFFGRERYARGKRDRKGSRNGYCPTTIKTTAGPVTLDRPKLRGTDGKFASRLLGIGVCRTNALESLVIAGFIRGLSVRDVEASLADALGAEATLSKSTVSRICEAIKDEFEVWSKRDLSDLRLDYLFLDGSHFKFHEGAASEPVLAAWGITSDGEPVLVGLAPGSTESHDAWADFLRELVLRGLTPPLLVVSDGAAGLIGAVEFVFGRSLRQRCLIHRCRNILAKVPASAQAEVKAAFWKLFDDVTSEPGQGAVEEVRRRIAAFAKHYGTTYPAAVKCLLADVESLTVYLRFPREHWKRIRHSNFIERTFGETRRRVKVIGRLPGERSCLSLVWAVLDRGSRGWRGVQHNPATTRLLADLRHQLLDPPVSITAKKDEENAVTRTDTAVA